MSNASKFCCIGCSVCLLLIGLIILLVSIGTLEPIEYGLVYNSVLKKVDMENPYKGGWYLIGPVQSFITFPATRVNIDWASFDGAKKAPLTGLKDNGGQQYLEFSFSLQYKINFDRLGKLYDKYKENFESLLLYPTVETTMRNEVAKYKSNQIWEGRKEMGNNILKALNETFIFRNTSTDEGNYVTIEGFQIINVKLLDSQERLLIDN